MRYRIEFFNKETKEWTVSLFSEEHGTVCRREAYNTFRHLASLRGENPYRLIEIPFSQNLDSVKELELK